MEKPIIFQVPKPKNDEQHKKLSDFKLKLAEYSNKLLTDDKSLDFVKFEIYPSEGIERKSLDELIDSFPYLGHDSV